MAGGLTPSIALFQKSAIHVRNEQSGATAGWTLDRSPSSGPREGVTGTGLPSRLLRQESRLQDWRSNVNYEDSDSTGDVTREFPSSPFPQPRHT